MLVADINSSKSIVTAAISSAAGAQTGSEGALPLINPCNKLACTSCANFGPTGVGTGLATPSAVTPNITKTAPSSGSFRNSAADCL